MNRPCYMVLDREFPGSISTRKLVIETAKLNVITTYSPDETIATLARFPNVDGVVFNPDIPGLSAEELKKRLRAIVPSITFIITSPGSPERDFENEYHVDSLDPKALLDCIQRLNERAVKEIAKQDPQVS